LGRRRLEFQPGRLLVRQPLRDPLDERLRLGLVPRRVDQQQHGQPAGPAVGSGRLHGCEGHFAPRNFFQVLDCDAEIRQPLPAILGQLGA